MIKALIVAGDCLPDACGMIHYTEQLRRELSGLGVDGATLESGSLLTLLAHGLPTVTTERDIRIPQLGHVATLVPPRRPDDLAALIAALLEDPARRSRLSAAGAAFTIPHSWRTIACRHVELYRHLRGSTRENAVTEIVPRAGGDTDAALCVKDRSAGPKTGHPPARSSAAGTGPAPVR